MQKKEACRPERSWGGGRGWGGGVDVWGKKGSGGKKSDEGTNLVHMNERIELKAGETTDTQRELGGDTPLPFQIEEGPLIPWKKGEKNNCRKHGEGGGQVYGKGNPYPEAAWHNTEGTKMDSISKKEGEGKGDP